MRSLQLILVASFVLGCAADSTAPPTSPLHPQFSVAAAGPEYPNVVRFEGQTWFFVQDPETDLIAWAGLSEHPEQSVLCGGAEPIDFFDFQFVGLLQDAVKGVISGGDVSLNVYRLSTFAGFCGSSPIAYGTGRVTYVDNDIYGSLTRLNSNGIRMEGTLSLAAGGQANLIAHNRFQYHTDGAIERIFRQVRLSGQ
jgi:hypothetical protein